MRISSNPIFIYCLISFLLKTPERDGPTSIMEPVSLTSQQRGSVEGQQHVTGENWSKPLGMTMLGRHLSGELPGGLGGETENKSRQATERVIGNGSRSGNCWNFPLSSLSMDYFSLGAALCVSVNKMILLCKVFCPSTEYKQHTI